MDNHKNEIYEINQRISENGETKSEIIRDLIQNSPKKFETIRKAYQRAQKLKQKKHGNQMFTDQDEKRLCSIILAFATSGMALSRSVFISFVRKIHKLPEDWRGDHWFNNFLKRNSDLVSHAFGKDRDTGRVNKVSEEVIELFMTEYKKLIDEKNYSDDFIINADESPCIFTETESSKILASANSEKQGPLSTPKSHLRTILPFVAASGRVWMIVLIYKDMSQSSNQNVNSIPVKTQLKMTRSTIPTYYATTTNGFITNELWKQIIETLVERLVAFKRGKPALLLLDRHSTHMELSSVNLMLDSNIQPLYLPAHTTHLLQPLDDVIFGSFKREVRLKRDLERMRRLLHGQKMHSIIEDIITEERSDIFKAKVIKAGFKRTGIWPFNNDLIRQKFKKEYMFSTKSQPHASQDEEVQVMASIIKDALVPQQTKVTTKRVHAGERNKLMTGEQMLTLSKEKEEKALQEKQAKELAKKEREDKKRKREEEKEERKELSKRHKLDQELMVAQRTCSFCHHIYTKKHKFWLCTSCGGYQVCTKCQKQDKADEHTAKCGSDRSIYRSELSFHIDELND